jgi:hypothetical protein
MKKMYGFFGAAMLFSAAAFGFDTVTVAKVTYIDEWDVGYTQVKLDSPTSCGSTWFWMSRTMPDYNLYMARILAAQLADRQIRIAERSPAYCDGSALYNPRVGVM